MIKVQLDIDTPMYPPRLVADKFGFPLERIRMWDKQGLFTIDAPKVGRGKVQKYTFLDVLRIVLIAYMDHFAMEKATSGQFADFIANRVRGRQKLGNLFGWEESLLLDEDKKNSAGEFTNPADGLTMDAEVGVFRWDHWGVKVGSRQETITHIHREIASVVRDRPVGWSDNGIVERLAPDAELDAPLSDDDYLHYCNDVGPLLPRIAIIPIGHSAAVSAVEVSSLRWPV